MKVVDKRPHYRVCLHSSTTGGTGDPFPFTGHQSVSKSGDGLYRQAFGSMCVCPNNCESESVTNMVAEL